jgi:hypothetical protein
MWLNIKKGQRGEEFFIKVRNDKKNVKRSKEKKVM